ncbi:hypothetical protein GALMADRAFT_155389 [Galerina marginata CBS 339.88]|uniref:Uncharacterized protein n=1 Tax=Galerina marginata (strain CBS 339.88) TaxID=685588 RepID=A0A067T2U0_GALM3|nr:hypothetical protein GALMADRAFT_155389 [Galerina marginata CBS 339.88]
MVHPAFVLRGLDDPPEQVPFHLRYWGPRTLSWHPKVTRYRLFVLATTIVLGTTKAVLTLRGSSVAPVTIEWVTGTLIFLLLFSVSAYDSQPDAPRSISWLFEPDCMDLVWKLLALFSTSRPRYISEERKTITAMNPEYPLITPYRILVCSAVTSFGVSKAVLGYYGLSTAMTWTDWALAVPVTTILYVLGLYEYNSFNLWRSFFVVDQSPSLYTVCVGLLCTLGAFLSTKWVLAFGHALWYILYDPSWRASQRPRGDKPTFRMRIEDGAIFPGLLFFQTCLAMAILGGIANLFLVLRLSFNALRQRRGPPGRFLYNACHPVVRVAVRIVPWVLGKCLKLRNYLSDNKEPGLANNPPHLVFRVLLYFGLHLLIMSGSLALAMSASALTFGTSVMLQETADSFLRTWLALLSIILAVATIGLLYIVFTVTCSLVSPILYLYSESRSSRDYHGVGIKVLERWFDNNLGIF